LGPAGRVAIGLGVDGAFVVPPPNGALGPCGSFPCTGGWNGCTGWPVGDSDGVGVPLGAVVVVPSVPPVVPELLVPPIFALVPVSAPDWLAAGVGVADEGEREPEPPLDPHAATSAMAPIGRSSLTFMVRPFIRAGRI
jgi:hypothetical protein